MFMSLIRFDPEKIPCQAGFEPGSSALEADALTTRPVRQSYGEESPAAIRNALMNSEPRNTPSATTSIGQLVTRTSLGSVHHWIPTRDGGNESI